MSIIKRIIKPIRSQPPSFLLEGVIGSGVTVISGQQGVGKTTAVLPLALAVIGALELEGIKPVGDNWRQVMYVTEDHQQVFRIIDAMIDDLGLDRELINERLSVSAAARAPIEDVVAEAEKLSVYLEAMGRDGVVVFDTKSACFQMADENSNDESAAMINALKQRFHDLNVWIVAHVSKASAAANNVQQMSSRGAVALEADAHQTLIIAQAKHGKGRSIHFQKSRFSTSISALALRAKTVECSNGVMKWTTTYCLPSALAGSPSVAFAPGRAAVLALLKEHPEGLTIYQLAEKREVGPVAIRKQLEVMEADGSVVSVMGPQQGRNKQRAKVYRMPTPPISPKAA